ncbi:LysM peptidoglycan-binding domain-containing protein [Desertibacillus haloalkaliphilus]|uniref:LysM peptidoglycan-binding domain-containing protein n=1 Tax=Desertibacillus haloalkaliphilus TaxID=1328930 RepID=UPI001C274691|nr:LysM peptidoglycan-binding domain-containing protein [Desertibacillus haloalkaliphilus]MBU8907502.1 LysM peptidoglycan-binding domain-containing protein [Desertibacillus haloalkaliphilus]
MLVHEVRANENLQTIARQYGVTADAIMQVNVICNPNHLLLGLPLVIPQDESEIAEITPWKYGANHYYVVVPGDTLTCIANQIPRNSVEGLRKSNRLYGTNQVSPGMELILGFGGIPDIDALVDRWTFPVEECLDLIDALRIGSFERLSYSWEVVGERGVPYLLPFLQHPCESLRFGAVLSLGRIGIGIETRAGLEQATRDRDPFIAKIARLGLKRHQLIPRWTKRVHVNIFAVDLMSNPNEYSPTTLVREGTPFIVHRYNVGARPTATGTNVYDLIQLVETGEVGYLPREGLAGMYMI